MSENNCGKDGHIYAGNGVCVFCKLQVAPPNKNDPWQLVAADPDLRRARSVLSMHEIRRIIRAGSLHAYEESARVAEDEGAHIVAAQIRALQP